MDNYMTADELRAVADYCESLQPLWDALTSGPTSGVSIDTEHIEVNVYDANGEKLGVVMWCDSGPAFYPVNNDVVSVDGLLPRQ